MSQYKNKASKLLVFFVVLGDLLIMNCVFSILYHIWPNLNIGPIFSGSYTEMVAFNTICYIMSTYYNGVVLHQRKVRNMHIVNRVTKNCAKFLVISVTLVALAGYENISTRFLILFHVVNYLSLIIWRIYCHHLIRSFRRKGRNMQHCVYLGCNDSILELYQEMSEKTSGYNLLGYFNDTPNEKLSQHIPYLGKPKDILAWLEGKEIHNVYSCLPSTESALIKDVIYWTEQNFVHFHTVPAVRNYLQRRMWYDTVGDVPILSLHQTPLAEFDNRILKRAFDLAVSGLFLCTFFPIIYIIVGCIIKITSPGPIFFKQKRNGINGEEFWCYKFRSMKVNLDADKIQATKNDPRKTKFGNFMRKTNIDELPQLINVFLGDMSLVGPRPHMVKHTEEYSQLIDTYMVRHFVKPGITGWAQVTGYRGETKELHQMEGRVKADIWYMEHWSFILDLNIIYKTFANAIHGEKNAY